MDLVEDLKTYCQKSTMFLFPMLGLPTNIKPISTYLIVDGIKSDNALLYALFPKSISGNANNKKTLMQHPMFEYNIVDGDFEIVVFNLEPIKNDYLLVVNGKYSHISQSNKVKVIGASRNKLADIGLYPSKYYDLYKNELEIEFNEEEGPELLDLPDFNGNEKLHVSEKIQSYLNKAIMSLS